MKHDPHMHRNALLRKYMKIDMPASELLKLIAPMDGMTEEEKETFAKGLLVKLEDENDGRTQAEEKADRSKD